MNFVFDTNIILNYLKDSPIKKIIENKYDPFGSDNTSIVSVISIGELKAFSLKNNWGNPRILKMNNIIKDFVIADINTEDIVDRYAEIDAFSQGRLNGKVSNFSARNMGKNDIWIAATASVLDATLLTTDNDFDHLDKEFFLKN